eukprot:TRINITY_DN6944_c0_g1_i1.p1 TRINITY_DN6944_c0_g1~~TRINITY_DN6944_c0_g1_i1.p1  ORF type:complete len:477 (-),score=20.58 TRINITY_DN6944_c0_g1_i1:99-1529(-)
MHHSKNRISNVEERNERRAFIFFGIVFFFVMVGIWPSLGNFFLDKRTNNSNGEHNDGTEQNSSLAFLNGIDHDTSKENLYFASPYGALISMNTFGIPNLLTMNKTVQERWNAGMTRLNPTVILLYDGNGLLKSAQWSAWETTSVIRPVRPYPQYIATPPNIVDLGDGALGVSISKTNCPYDCIFTRDDTAISGANGIVIELSNHKKLLGAKLAREIPYPWPKFVNPSANLILFYNEPGEHHQELQQPDVLNKFDIVMHTNREHPIGKPDAEKLRITSICSWGQPVYEFLRHDPDAFYNKLDLVLHLKHHLVAPSISPFVGKLLSRLHADNMAADFKFREYNGMTIPARIHHYRKFKFVLLTENSLERDWVAMDFSQLLLSDTIILYYGAANIVNLAPSINHERYPSIVQLSSFETVEDALLEINRIKNNFEAYEHFFEWKRHGLGRNFLESLDHCVYYADCRLCQRVTDRSLFGLY